MLVLLRYFLFTLLFTSMGFGFIVGDWQFDDNNASYVNNIEESARDSSGNNIHGNPGREVKLSTDTPLRLKGTSVQFAGQASASGGNVFIPHNDKMLLDSGKISFWFKVKDFEGESNGGYIRGVLSKDAYQTRDSGDLTFMIIDHINQNEKLGTWPSNIQNDNNIYLAVRLQTSTGSESSQLSFHVSPNVVIQENKWYFVEYIFGSSDFGMKVTLWDERNRRLGDASFPYYGGVSDVYGYDVDLRKATEINGTRETTGLGGLSWGDARGASVMSEYYKGNMDALRWETYEEPVLVHYFDECVQNNGTKLKNYANDYTKGEKSKTTIKGGTSKMTDDGKIIRAVDLKSASDYVELDTGLINNAGIKDFSVIVWIKTTQDGTIVSTNNNDISLKLQGNNLIAQVKGEKYTFRLKNSIKDNRWHQVILTRKIHIFNEKWNQIAGLDKSYKTQAKIEMSLDNTYLGRFFTLKDDLPTVVDKINVRFMHLGEGFVGQIDEFTLLKNKLSKYTVSTLTEFADEGRNWDGNLRTEEDCLMLADNNLTITDVIDDEGDKGTTPFEFQVTVERDLTNPLQQTIEVDYRVVDGNSNPAATTANNDYTPIAGHLTFKPLETSKTFIVNVIGDTTVEPDETFRVELYNPKNVTITKEVGIGTIRNDDSEASFTISSPTVTEGESLVFNIALTKSINTSTTITLHTEDISTEGADDYGSPSLTTVTIPAGSTATSVSVPTVADKIYEGTETMRLVGTVTSGNIVNATAAGIGTIKDDGSKPTLSIEKAEATEGASLIFKATLSGKSATATTFTINTADIEAKADSDYVSLTQTLFTIAVDATTVDITVQTINDNNPEQTETMEVKATVTSNNTENNTAGAIGTIIDDDLTLLSIADYKDKEGDANTTTPFKFVVSLNTPISTDVTVNYTTKDGSATIEDEDYNQTNGQLTIKANETNATIFVDVIGDNKVEEDEKFYVILSNPSPNSTISDGNAIGTIENDDNATIVIHDANVTEGDTGFKYMEFNVTMSSPHYAKVKLNYVTKQRTAGDIATEGEGYSVGVDYNKTSGEIIFEPGMTFTTIKVPVFGDLAIEENETFEVKLSHLIGTDVSISKDTGLGTIIDDDSGFPANQITFNVERTNSVTDGINTDARNAWYTQVSGRTFAYDVVVYNQEMNALYPLNNVVVKVDLMTNNATAGSQSIDTRYGYFDESGASRITFNNVTIDDAAKNARFAVTVVTNGTVLYKYDCSNNNAKACYDVLMNSANYEPRDTKSTNARDNFAIRPAGYKYTITAEGSNPLIDNSTANDTKIHLAAEETYTYNVKALRYTETNNTDITGYNDITVEQKVTFAGDKSCNDTEDKDETIKFTQGQVNNSSYDINQTGLYTISILDENWTQVDQNTGDCIKDNGDIDNSDINAKQGCNIVSEMTLAGTDYTDQTVTVYPYKFKIALESTSDPKNMETIYMNTITADKTTMSKQIDVNITAMSKEDNNLSNFTNGCMAERLTLDINFTAASGLTTIFDENQEQHNIYLTVENQELQKIEQERTQDRNGVAAMKFEKDDEGLAKISLNYNIDRSDTNPMNPETITMKELKVTSPKAYHNTTQSEEVVPEGKSTVPVTDTFLYARVRASTPLYRQEEGSDINTTHIIDVYCLSSDDGVCVDTLNVPVRPLYGKYTNMSSKGWWASTFINAITTNQASDITIVPKKNEITIHKGKLIDLADTPQRDSNDSINNATNAALVTVTCPNRNIVADVLLDEDLTAQWLIYNNNPYFSVRCDGASDWAGQGNVHSVLQGATIQAEAVIDPDNPPPAAGTAETRTPTYRLSW